LKGKTTFAGTVSGMYQTGLLVFPGGFSTVSRGFVTVDIQIFAMDQVKSTKIGVKSNKPGLTWRMYDIGDNVVDVDVKNVVKYQMKSMNWVSLQSLTLSPTFNFQIRIINFTNSSFTLKVTFHHNQNDIPAMLMFNPT
jgi:hypothetical protein